MLNEDKIRLMNEIARYEKKERRDERPAKLYFRTDYVGKHMIQSFFAYTLSFLILLVFRFLYSLESILNAADISAVTDFLRKNAVLYAAGLVVFEVITAAVYRRRYTVSKKKLEEHLTRVNRLKKRYDLRDRMKELAKEGGRNA